MSKTLKVCPAQGFRVSGTFKDFRYDVRSPYTEIDFSKAIDLIAAGLVSLVRFLDGKPVNQISDEELKKELAKRDRIEPTPLFNPPAETKVDNLDDIKKTLADQQAVLAAQQKTIAEQQNQIAELLKQKDSSADKD